jgi:hypothetical protein
LPISGTPYSASNRVGVVNFTLAPGSPAPGIKDLAASRSVGGVLLSWTHLGSSVTGYEVWRSSEPYFVPGASGSEKRGETQSPDSGTKVNYLDAGAAGTGGTSYFYVILPISGTPHSASNRVGVVNFTLAAGTATPAPIRTVDCRDRQAGIFASFRPQGFRPLLLHANRSG